MLRAISSKSRIATCGERTATRFAMYKLVTAVYLSLSATSLSAADQATAQSDKPTDVAGKVSTGQNKPMAGIDVELWKLDTTKFKRLANKVRVARTDSQGRFQLGRIPKPKVISTSFHVVVARPMEFGPLRKDLIPGLEHIPGYKPDELEFRFAKPTAEITGVVVGPDDKPLANVRICNVAADPPELGAGEFRTDKNGRFRVPFSRPFDSTVRGGTVNFRRLVSEQFGQVRFAFVKAPDEVTLKLPRPAIVTFRTVTGPNNRPLPGVHIGPQESNDSPPASDSFAPVPETTALSDAQGNVRLVLAGSGRFNLLCDAATQDLVAPAIEGINVTAGEMQNLADIVFTPGALVRGQLINETTRQPIRLQKQEIAQIGAHGPKNPTSSAAVTGARVRNDGSFEIRLAPGANYLYLMARQHFVSPFDGVNRRMMDLELKEGEIRNLVFPVSPKQPGERDDS